MSGLEIYESSWKLANRVHLTPFVPKAMQGKPEHVLACVLYGRELGLGPMQSLNSIHVIEGRAAASPELMRALVANAGHRIDVTENTNSSCSMKGVRVDTGAEATVRWTMEDAKLAGLTHKDNWKKYPRAMLAARCTSELCRLLFPDVIAGLSYTPEEVESFDDILIKVDERSASVPVAEIAVPLDDIVDAVIVEPDAVPHAVSTGPDEPSGATSPSGPDPLVLVLDAFPESEIIVGTVDDSDAIKGQLLPSADVLAQRRKDVKAWGNWNRIRAIAMPIARGEGLPVPDGIENLIADDKLFELVAKAVPR